jgi:thioredoxin reductase (NADPH)
MDNRKHSDVTIIGSGPAGYTAAIYAARAGLSVMIIAGVQKGGQLMLTTDVENYPGFANAIQGPWLMEQMEAQVQHCGAEIVSRDVIEVDFSTSPFVLKCDDGSVYTGKTVIVATGAHAKWLEIESETKYRGYGVSACATCDGVFFRNKNVFVVGGGNTAMEDALFLVNHAASVTIVHRRDTFRAEKVLQERVFAHSKIKVIWNHVVEEILGTDQPQLKVTGVKLKDINTGEITDNMADGIFIAIGHKPNTELFKDFLKIDQDGYITTKPDSTVTNIAGVYAAGDVKDKIYRQAITAAGTGCMAALDASKFLGHAIPTY